MTCPDCGTPKQPNRGGRMYCPECCTPACKPRVRFCPQGHEKTDDNVFLWRNGAGREHRACKQCIFDRRAAATAKRRQRSRAQQEWFDWVVVERVITDGFTDPGRPLTEAEWFAVFDKVGSTLSNTELADRGHSTTRTVQRMRRAYERRAAA